MVTGSMQAPRKRRGVGDKGLGEDCGKPDVHKPRKPGALSRLLYKVLDCQSILRKLGAPHMSWSIRASCHNQGTSTRIEKIQKITVSDVSQSLHWVL